MEPMGRDAFAGRSDVIREAVTDAPMAGWPAEAFSFASASPGTWRFDISTRSAPARWADRPDGWLVVGGDSPWKLYSHFASRDFHVGGRVPVLAYLYDDDLRRANRAGDDECSLGFGARAAGVQGAIAAVSGTLYDPSERASAVPMFDDGRHGDGPAGDGVFGGLVEFFEPGAHRLEIVAEGRTPDGQGFVRTTAHAMPAIERPLALEGWATGEPEDDLLLRVDLPLRALLHDLPLHVQLAAEAWGTGPDGGEVPVCWLGRMAAPRPSADGSGGLEASMWLDSRWIDLAGAQGPFELRNVRVIEPNSQVAIARAARLPLRLEGGLPARAGSAPVAAPTPDMMAARAPGGRTLPLSESVREFARLARSGGRHENLSPGSHSLMVSHGYCSVDVWNKPPFDGFPDVGATFAEPKVFFEDYLKNRSHDEFAQRLYVLGRELKSFGLVAHSQGGCASLHLWTYYYSGLDWARGPGTKLIQSVGSPYQGTSLASLGWLACGTAVNMTYDGAAAWLSGIPQERRAAVWHHTADYEGEGFGKYCNLATVLLLDKPEDGVVEHLCGQLPGAHNEGLKIPWCHGYELVMKHPSECSDPVRNAAMSADALR
jgi:hypothetical protein